MANRADPEKPTDLDLHCLQRQGISGSAGQGLNALTTQLKHLRNTEMNVCHSPQCQIFCWFSSENTLVSAIVVATSCFFFSLPEN